MTTGRAPLTMLGGTAAACVGDACILPGAGTAVARPEATEGDD
jgi:hypothetical protein